MSTKRNTKPKPNELEPLKGKRVIDHAQVDNLPAFVAALINYAFVIVLTLVLFFAVSFPIMRNDANYLKNEKIVLDTKEQYSLTLPQTGYTNEKMDVLQGFYLNSFKDAIKNDYNEQRGTNYSIEHIYNVVVYQLPAEPTPTDYSTTYFSYLLDDKGIPMVDVLGKSKYDELGKRGQEDLQGIIQSAYSRLNTLTQAYAPGYKQAVDYCMDYESIARVIPYGVALAIVFILLPIIFKHGASLGEKIMHLGYANKRSGYSVSFWKLPVRAVLYGALATVGVYMFYPHFVLIFCVFPYFLNALYRLFSYGRRGLIEKFLFMVPVDTRYEKIYRNEAELLQEGETMLSGYSDPAYTATLSSVETISLEDRGDGAH